MFSAKNPGIGCGISFFVEGEGEGGGGETLVLGYGILSKGGFWGGVCWVGDGGQGKRNKTRDNTLIESNGNI